MLGLDIRAFVCAYGFEVSNARVMVRLLALPPDAVKERQTASSLFVLETKETKKLAGKQITYLHKLRRK